MTTKTRIAFFDSHGFEIEGFKSANAKFDFDIEFIEARLSAKTARLALGADVVCSFVNDHIDAECLKRLSELKIKLIALRSAGFSHVDVKTATELGLPVVRVPGYSPNAVAEYTVGLLLNLNRKIHRSYSRVKELNFSLDGLTGFDLNKKTVGVVGTGKIGCVFAKIMAAFGCRILAFDLEPAKELASLSAVEYTDFQTLCRESDVISLHVPLTPKTHHLIDDAAIAQMKKGVFILNTGRGGLIDAKALIRGLKSEKIGATALDVYEEEEAVFFHDLSGQILQDDVLARLLTFPNVLITAHQAFLTREALANIAQATLESIDEFKRTGTVLGPKLVVPPLRG